MNNNGYVSETLTVKIDDQLASVCQPMKSTDLFQDLTVFLPVFFFFGPESNYRPHIDISPWFPLI